MLWDYHPNMYLGHQWVALGHVFLWCWKYNLGQPLAKAVFDKKKIILRQCTYNWCNFNNMVLQNLITRNDFVLKLAAGKVCMSYLCPNGNYPAVSTIANQKPGGSGISCKPLALHQEISPGMRNRHGITSWDKHQTSIDHVQKGRIMALLNPRQKFLTT